MRIKKVFNSSVVLASGPDDAELILLGKGIGYGQRPGDVVPEGAPDRFFVPVRNPVAKELLQLLDSIEPEYLELTREIIAYAEQVLGTELHQHLYVALTDHLHFAVERAHAGLPVVNRLAWEIRSYYPVEYRIGRYGLDRLREQLHVQLPDDEAANIAFHIANARHTRDIVRRIALECFEIEKLIDPNTIFFGETLRLE